MIVVKGGHRGTDSQDTEFDGLNLITLIDIMHVMEISEYDIWCHETLYPPK